MNDNNTRDELIAEAISLIQIAEDWQIQKAIEAALNIKEKTA